jgi:Ice-binding-like
MAHKNLFGLVSLVLVALFLSQVVNAAGPAAVNLGSAGNFTVLAQTGISTTGTTSIVGNIGVSPAAATYITGFGLALNSSGTFSTTPIVTGDVYSASYNAPTPAMMTSAISAMQTAYTYAAGVPNPTATELGTGIIGGMTLTPGLYKWSTTVTIPTNVTLSGGPNDVWIFQIAQNLNVANGARVILSGGAQSKNVFWIVSGQATIGTTANFQGVILSQTAIVVNTGAQVNGRLMAQSAVTLNADTVTAPTGSSTTMPTTTIAAATTTVVTAAPTTTVAAAPTTTVAAAPTTTVVTAAPTTMVGATPTVPTTTVQVSTGNAQPNVLQQIWNAIVSFFSHL